MLSESSEFIYRFDMVEGYDDYYAGKNETDCPYPESHESHWAWLRGWDIAKKEYE